VLIFTLPIVMAELLAILCFFAKYMLQKYLRPMLPPGGRNWKLIYPNLSTIQPPLSWYHCALSGRDE
jgi:hypothetical protein